MSSDIATELQDDAVLSREGLAAQVHQKLRTAMMRGRFMPGEKMKLRDLAAEYGVSPTPVREALVRLVSEGALEQDGHRSVRVPKISPATFSEIGQLRILLEGRAAQFAAGKSTPDDIRVLTEVQERLIAARKSADCLQALDANQIFHMKICSIADQPILTRIIEGLWLRCGPVFWALTQIGPLHDPADHPHMHIVRGLANRDGSLAKLALSHDISMFMESAMRNADILNTTDS